MNFLLRNENLWSCFSGTEGIDAPENTLKAAKQAKVNGAKCVTFDVAFTFDGVAVASSRPEVALKTFADVRQIDASDGHVLVKNRAFNIKIVCRQRCSFL